MKKCILITALFAIMAAPLFAQEENDLQQEAGPLAPISYFVNVSVERIIPTRYGFIVQHRTGSGAGMARVVIPNDWFTYAGGRAERIVLPLGNMWPSMTVFYRDGEFSHVRLYVHRSPEHFTWSWGSAIPTTELRELFYNVETVQIRR